MDGGEIITLLLSCSILTKKKHTDKKGNINKALDLFLRHQVIPVKDEEDP